jgi:protein TonB
MWRRNGDLAAGVACSLAVHAGLLLFLPQPDRARRAQETRRSPAIVYAPAPGAQSSPPAARARAEAMAGREAPPRAAPPPRPKRLSSRRRDTRARRVERPTSDAHRRAEAASAPAAPSQPPASAVDETAALPPSGPDRHEEIDLYLARLRARLEAVKRYPGYARRRRTEGTAMVAITIGRDGRTTQVVLSRTSGSALLDREAEEMVSRAAPFEPIPASVGDASLRVVVPVAFRLDG